MMFCCMRFADSISKRNVKMTVRPVGADLMFEIGADVRVGQEITYCPFCGKKIETVYAGDEE